MRNNSLLRGVLLLAGVVVVFLGLNAGLGGIRTLGRQGGTAEMLTVTDPAPFAVRDNHARFIGGVWLGAGLLLIASAVWLEKLRTVVMAIAAMVFVGGIVRFSGGNLGLLLSPAIAPSLVAELVGFPLLALWVGGTARR